MKLKPYPKYKPAGVEWLGKIPVEWGAFPVKQYFSVQLGKMLQNTSQNKSDFLVPYIKAMHVQWGAINVSNLPEMWASLAEVTQYSVKENDLLVCEGGEVGRAAIIGTPPEFCIIQNALHRVRAKAKSDTRYLLYVLYVVKNSMWFDVLCNKATIAHFTSEKFGDLRIPVPSLDEQSAIVAFLDHETVRIDALIEKKERQIELLQEKRTALISHAATKGLNPNAKMKPSGIDWLGEIPEHWYWRKLKHISKVQFSSVDKKSNEGEEIVKLCNYVDVYYNDYIDNNLDFMDATASKNEVVKFALARGDVLLTKDSESWNDIAIPAFIQSECPGVICGYHLAHVRPKKNILDGEYLFRSFQTRGINDQFRISATGVTRFGLGKDDLDGSLFPLPPLDDQVVITNYLGKETAKIDTLLDKTEKSIDLLREYRTALISSAVTGKVDVRGEA